MTRPERETLKAIFRRTQRGAEARLTALSEDLGVSPGTVSATLKRLVERGLVDHHPYRGVTLQADGRRAALRVIRRHRIVERFLADHLGYAWNEADRLAKAFEHDLPDEVEERLFLALGRPTSCPHGFPIPSLDEADLPDLEDLYDLEPGDVADVALSDRTDPAIVEFLDELGVRPGARVEILEKHPFDGPLIVRVHPTDPASATPAVDRTLSERVAREVLVTGNHRAGTDAGPDDVHTERATA